MLRELGRRRKTVRNGLGVKLLKDLAGLLWYNFGNFNF